MDVLTPEQRRRCMQSNKGKGTKPEIAFGRLMWSAGIRYRKHPKGVPGTPDFCIRKYRMAIFVDGEFWHGRDWPRKKPTIKNNRDFWIAKMYPVDTQTVGQFTGITDIKGTPIYENDLVLAAEDLSGNTFQWGLCKVFYFCEDKDDPTGEVGFWTEVGYPSGYRYNRLSAYKLNYYRVVGNTHDDDHLFYQDFTDAYGENIFYLGDWWASENDDSDRKLQEYLKELKQNLRKNK